MAKNKYRKMQEAIGRFCKSTDCQSCIVHYSFGYDMMRQNAKVECPFYEIATTISGKKCNKNGCSGCKHESYCT